MPEDEFSGGAASTVGLVTSAALAAHEADTTAIHGFTDTSKVVLTDVGNTLTSPTAGTTPITVKGAASQTGDLILVSSSALASLLRVLADGGVVSAGDVKANTVGKGLVTRSPDGTPYRLNIANGGALSTSDASEVLDSFTRADETPLTTADTGQAWTAAVGTGLSVIGNQCGKVTSGTQASVINSGLADKVVTATLAAEGTSIDRIMLRWNDINNQLFLRQQTGALSQLIAGVTTALGTLSGGPLQAGDVIVATLNGANITIVRNGVSELTTTTALLTGTSDGPYTNNTTFRVDNFAVRSL